MPLTSKTFSQLIDFTRTSAATYVDQLGRIVPTPVSLNEYTFTQEFDNVAWSRNSSTLTANNALAPDGSMTADTFTAQAGTALRPEMTQVVSTVSGGLYTISYNVRPVTHSFIQIIINAQVAEWVNFTLSGAGTATANGPCAASIVLDPLTGWYRISMTYTAGGTDRRPVLCMIPSAAAGRAATFNPLGTEVIRVWGAQLEQTPDANLTLGSELNAAAVPFTVFRDGSTSTPSPTIATAVSGTVYRLQLNISANTSNASASIRVNGVPSTASIAVGVTGNVILYFTAAGNGAITIAGDNNLTNLTVTSVSLRAITAASPSTYTRNFGGRFPPRFDYDPVTLAPRGLLIEEQRTNLLVRSEELDHTFWSKSRTTVTPNAATSPDGTVDADKLIEDTAAGTHRVFQQATKAASVVTRTFSVYLKAAERTLARITVSNNNEGVTTSTDINLSTGTATAASTPQDGTISGQSASIINAGNGWYRCIITATLDASITTPGAFIFLRDGSGNFSYTGNGTSGIFVWGAQWEDGAFATSYIPTTTSQVTRTADSAAITGANFSSWFNQPEGTFVLEASTASTTAFPVIVGYNASSTASAAYLQANQAASWNGSAVLATGAGTVNSNVPVKVAMAYNATGRALVLNGGSVATDANQLGTANLLAIGRPGNAATSQLLNGHIRSIRYYPTRLTNAQLQALTA